MGSIWSNNQSAHSIQSLPETLYLQSCENIDTEEILKILEIIENKKIVFDIYYNRKGLLTIEKIEPFSKLNSRENIKLLNELMKRNNLYVIMVRDRGWNMDAGLYQRYYYYIKEIFYDEAHGIPFNKIKEICSIEYSQYRIRDCYLLSNIIYISARNMGNIRALTMQNIL